MIDQTRRNVIAMIGAAAGAAVAPDAIGDAVAAPKMAGTPWYRTARRCGGLQFNERDPIDMDVGWWVDYWSSLKIDVTRLMAGGIVAYYPTQIPFHYRNPFLGSRDLFGEFAKACKARNIRISARMDTRFVREDAAKAHPEWLARDADGSLRKPDASGLYSTCLYSTYYTEQIPAIVREVSAMYDVDAFQTNAFPTAGAGWPVPCYCDACSLKELRDPHSPAAYQRFIDRVREVCLLWDKAAKEKKPDSLYCMNLGGGLAIVPNLREMAEGFAWINNDHQSRENGGAVWDCAQQGRVSGSYMQGRFTSISTASYLADWRWASKSPLELKMWMAQAAATGMANLIVANGGKEQKVDRRWIKPTQDFYQWMARHDAHFVNEAPVANLAVVWSQSSNAYYKPPSAGGRQRGSDTDAGNVDYGQGMYQALLEGRFFFDFVHEDDLTAERLSKYKGLILPNCATLSDTQCQQLRDYVNRGGSLLATFETGFYDEHGHARAQSGLADIFGIQKTAPVEGRPDIYMHVERDHPILSGFADTTMLPFCDQYVPLQAVPNPLATMRSLVPYSPTEYMHEVPTDRPAMVLSERGASRLVYLSGDTDKAFWRSQVPDLSRILINAIRWMCPQAPITVTGKGLVEMVAWKTKPGYALHFLNYENSRTMRGMYMEADPVGPQTVRMTVPADAKLSHVRLLAAGTILPVTRSGNDIVFTVPAIADYEVAAIT